MLRGKLRGQAIDQQKGRGTFVWIQTKCATVLRKDANNAEGGSN